MTTVEKSDVIHSVRKQFFKCAAWRRTQAVRYPTDTRNVPAAQTLELLAGEAQKLSDEQFRALAPHFNSFRWKDSVSYAARRVGFDDNITTLSDVHASILGMLNVKPGVMH